MKAREPLNGEDIGSCLLLLFVLKKRINFIGANKLYRFRSFFSKIHVFDSYNKKKKVQDNNLHKKL